MKKSMIRRFERTTSEERWRDFLKTTGKSETEMPLKKYIELEYRVLIQGRR